MTSEVERTGFCHYCGQKITLTDCGYDDFWCADPPGGLGTAVCPARDDDRHWPGPDPEDDDLSTPAQSPVPGVRGEANPGTGQTTVTPTFHGDGGRGPGADALRPGPDQGGDLA